MEHLKTWLPKFYWMLLISWVLVSSWMIYGLQSFRILVVIASGFSMILWGTIKFFELLTGSQQNQQSSKTTDSNCALGDLTFDIQTGHHAIDVAHIPHCNSIDLSCLDGFPH